MKNKSSNKPECNYKDNKINKKNLWHKCATNQIENVDETPKPNTWHPLGNDVNDINKFTSIFIAKQFIYFHFYK